MAKLGNKNKVYILTGQAEGQPSASDWLVGETSNSFNLNANLVEVSDKSTAWQSFISGIKGATLDVTVNVDSKDAKQKALLDALMNGSEVDAYVGDIDESSGFKFKALVGSISDTSDNGSVASRSFSLTANGAVTPVTGA